MKILLGIDLGKGKNSRNLLIRGQALLIVLLTMSVILTVVLSVVSRSITDITITSYEEESQRAFDAAEAGVERSLLTEFQGAYQLDYSTGTSYDVSHDYPVPTADEYVYPDNILSGSSATFWFVSHNETGSLSCNTGPCPSCPGTCFGGSGLQQIEICWGEDVPGSPNEHSPAIEIAIFYDETLGAIASTNNFSNVEVYRLAYDPFTSRGSANGFFPASGSCSVGGQEFKYSTGNISIRNVLPPGAACSGASGCVLMVKVRTLYNNEAQPLAINGNNLPSQGRAIESTGSSGESRRKVELFQTFAELPFIFDSAVFSPVGLGHN